MELSLMKNTCCSTVQPLCGCVVCCMVMHCISCSVIQIKSLWDYCVTNQFGYKNYDLSEEEIKIVEGV